MQRHLGLMNVVGCSRLSAGAYAEHVLYALHLLSSVPAVLSHCCPVCAMQGCGVQLPTATRLTSGSVATVSH